MNPAKDREIRKEIFAYFRIDICFSCMRCFEMPKIILLNLLFNSFIFRHLHSFSFVFLFGFNIKRKYLKKNLSPFNISCIFAQMRFTETSLCRKYSMVSSILVKLTGFYSDRAR